MRKKYRQSQNSVTISIWKHISLLMFLFACIVPISFFFGRHSLTSNQQLLAAIMSITIFTLACLQVYMDFSHYFKSIITSIKTIINTTFFQFCLLILSVLDRIKNTIKAHQIQLSLLCSAVFEIPIGFLLNVFIIWLFEVCNASSFNEQEKKIMCILVSITHVFLVKKYYQVMQSLISDKEYLLPLQKVLFFTLLLIGISNCFTTIYASLHLFYPDTLYLSEEVLSVSNYSIYELCFEISYFSFMTLLTIGCEMTANNIIGRIVVLIESFVFVILISFFLLSDSFNNKIPNGTNTYTNANLQSPAGSHNQPHENQQI